MRTVLQILLIVWLACIGAYLISLYDKPISVREAQWGDACIVTFYPGEGQRRVYFPKTVKVEGYNYSFLSRGFNKVSLPAARTVVENCLIYY